MGAVGRLPVEWSPLGAAALWIFWRRGAFETATLYGVMAIAALVTGGLVAAIVHTSLSSYYPTKMFWHAVTFAVPLVCAAAGITYSAPRREEHAGTRIHTLARWLAGALTVLALLTPLSVVAQDRDPDVEETLAAVTQADAPQTEVAWRVTPDSSGDGLAFMLLGFYSLVPGPARMEEPMTHDLACDRLRSSAAPAVLTSATQREISQEFACASSVRALHVEP